MFEFLLGVVSGGLVGAAASFVKNPSTKKPIREDIRKYAKDLEESCNDVKKNYQELQNNRNLQEVAPATSDEVTDVHITPKDKANDLVTAVKTVASKNKHLDDIISKTKEKATDLKSKAKEKATDAKTKAESEAENVKTKVSEKHTEFKEDFAKKEIKAKKELSDLENKIKQLDKNNKK